MSELHKEYCLLNESDQPITEPYLGEAGLRAIELRLALYKEQFPDRTFVIGVREVGKFSRVSLG